jgi:hypothetical protein
MIHLGPEEESAPAADVVGGIFLLDSFWRPSGLV